MGAEPHSYMSGMHLLQHSLSSAALKQSVPWAAASTDPSKFRSLLLHPGKFKSVQLYIQHCPDTSDPSYAVTRELADGGFRLGIYGNLLAQPDYAQAGEQILAACQGSTCRFSALPAAAVPDIRAAFTSHGYREVYSAPCWEYTLQGPLVQQLEALDFSTQLQHQLGSQYELSTLVLEDAELVNSLWTYKGPNTLQMIQQLIQEHHTSCVRTLPDRQPVAWMLECDPGMAGMLHTLQQYRRKGLARIVVMDLLSKLHHQLQQQTDLVQQMISATTGKPDTTSVGDKQSEDVDSLQQTEVWPGGHVYAYVVQDNTASAALFDSLGLDRSGEFWWIGFDLPSP